MRFRERKQLWLVFDKFGRHQEAEDGGPNASLSDSSSVSENRRRYPPVGVICANFAGGCECCLIVIEDAKAGRTGA